MIPGLLSSVAVILNKAKRSEESQSVISYTDEILRYTQNDPKRHYLNRTEQPWV
jgi:hypothetical protein